MRTFTRSEVLNADALNDGKKNAEAPFLMIIDNKVYDVREFVPDHPGGSVILTHVGKDGTGMFSSHLQTYSFQRRAQLRQQRRSLSRAFLTHVHSSGEAF